MNTHTHTHTHIYIYIEREREREREKDKETGIESKIDRKTNRKKGKVDMPLIWFSFVCFILFFFFACFFLPLYFSNQGQKEIIFCTLHLLFYCFRAPVNHLDTDLLSKKHQL